ncbi:MAG: pantetheine-phosphate adenylyltransferase [Nocardioidaceae bacterium]|nr:pantetheine-phosphate adenylyltransferase [Nocardioidaceae bacterium]
MPTAVCPGSFDPVTHGHLDIIVRAARLFEHVTVAVLVNPAKHGLFSVDERVEMLREVTADLPHVSIETFEGLLVDFCRKRDITAIVKGLRAVTDFEYELQMAQMNTRLAGVETVFVPTSPEWSFLAASLVKEVAAHDGDVSGLVAPGVLSRLRQRLGRD